MNPYPKPQSEIVVDLLCRLDERQREAYEERAGILEFSAGLSRGHAECLALLDVLRGHPDALAGVTVLQIELDGGTEWLLATEVQFARRYVADLGGKEIGVHNLAKVVWEQYGGVATLTTLG